MFSCARREKAEGKRDVTDIDRLRGRSLGDMLATPYFQYVTEPGDSCE